MSLAEIMNEIRTIANKHNSDDHDSEEIMKKMKEIKEMANSLKSRLNINVKTSFIFCEFNPKKNDY
jgi:hypothetical protein